MSPESKRWSLPAKTKGIGIGVAVALGLGGAAFVAGKTPLLDIERVQVAGVHQLRAEDVKEAAQLRPGAPLMSVNEAAVEQRLEAMTWVSEATVSTRLPSDVSIEIVEHKPVALIRTTDNRWAQLDSTGHVLSVGDVPVPGLPAILSTTVTGEGAVLDAASMVLIDVARTLPNSLRPRVLQMVAEPAGIRLGLDAGTIVELGDAQQLSDKLMAAAAVLSHTDPKGVAVLDVRSPHLPIATPTAAAVAAKRP